VVSATVLAVLRVLAMHLAYAIRTYSVKR